MFVLGAIRFCLSMLDKVFFFFFKKLDIRSKNQLFRGDQSHHPFAEVPFKPEQDLDLHIETGTRRIEPEILRGAKCSSRRGNLIVCLLTCSINQQTIHAICIFHFQSNGYPSLSCYSIPNSRSYKSPHAIMSCFSQTWLQDHFP